MWRIAFLLVCIISGVQGLRCMCVFERAVSSPSPCRGPTGSAVERMRHIYDSQGEIPALASRLQSLKRLNVFPPRSRAIERMASPISGAGGLRGRVTKFLGNKQGSGQGWGLGVHGSWFGLAVERAGLLHCQVLEFRNRPGIKKICTKTLICGLHR